MAATDYTADAFFSLLIYDLSDSKYSLNQDQTVKDILDSRTDWADHDQLRSIAEANNLLDAKIVDASWANSDEYGTMNAATFILEDGSVHVAYRGTGNHNWDYNSGSAYGTGSSQMQKWACEYFDKSMEKLVDSGTAFGDVHVTGHSQGGNNAMYVNFESKYKDIIDTCVSLDGPGFNAEYIQEVREKYDEEAYNELIHKIYAINGENDPVHQLGEVRSYEFFGENERGDHVFYVEATMEDGIGATHDLHSHFYKNASGTWGLGDPCEPGPVALLALELADNVLKLDKKDRIHAGETVMALIEVFGGDGNWPEEFDLTDVRDIISTVADGVPNLLWTLVTNPELVADSLDETQLTKLVSDFIATNQDKITLFIHDHPIEAIGLIYVAAVLTPITKVIVYSVAGTLALLFAMVAFVDKILDIVEAIVDIAQEIFDCIKGMLEAIRDAFTQLKAWLRANSPGGKYTSSQPVIIADPEKLREYASRIAFVNRRLASLDGDMNSLYWQVGFLDLLAILEANLLTSWSYRLSWAQNWLEEAAQELDNADATALAALPDM